MKNELLITTRQGQVLTLQTEDGKICQIQAEDDREGSLLGNIYVGKVRNIVKNIKAAFVEFQKGQMGYLPLEEKICPIHTDGRSFQEGRVLIGDEVIVQIKREAIGTKPPTLTGMLELSGQKLVLLAGRGQINISSRIRQESERTRLKEILSRLVTEEYGFIARTNSVNTSEQELENEAERLAEKYQEIVGWGRHRTQFCCLHRTLSGYLCHVRDADYTNVERILTDDEEIYHEVRDYLESTSPDLCSRLVLWNPDNVKMDAVFNITRTLEHALMPKVWLKSGAYLVIQPTEAFVSIDVNTGKAISKKGDVQKTFCKVNSEAAWEIARQLRLRNLSGIILIDFIDMKSEEDIETLMKTLREAVSSDPVRCHVVDMTKLGLVEMTRRKMRKPLYQQISRMEKEV